MCVDFWDQVEHVVRIERASRGLRGGSTHVGLDLQGVGAASGDFVEGFNFSSHTLETVLTRS